MSGQSSTLYGYTVPPEVAWSICALGADVINRAKPAPGEFEAARGQYLAIGAGVLFDRQFSHFDARAFRRVFARAAADGWTVAPGMGSRRSAKSGPAHVPIWTCQKLGADLVVLQRSAVVVGKVVAIARVAAAGAGVASAWSAHATVGGYQLAEVVVLRSPVPADGHPGLWTPGEDLRDQLCAAWLESVNAH